MTLQQYSSDSFVTGGRGTPNAWSPASDVTDNWIQASGAAAPSIVTAAAQLRGQLTGDTTANVWELGANQFIDTDQYVRVNVSNTAVKVGLIARASSATTYYRADVTGTTLEILLDNGGTNTPLVTATVSFAANTYYWLHFRVQGFGATGSNPHNLLVNFWLDPAAGAGNAPTGEPAGWLLATSDSTLYRVGNYGVSYKATGVGQSATYDSYSCTDCPAPTNAPAYNVTQTRPYGVTFFAASTPPPMPQQMITDLIGPNSASSTGWGNGVNVRYQLKWFVIETVQGVYDWARLDHAVQMANYNGVRYFCSVDFPPAWQLTLDAFGNDSLLAAATQGLGATYSAANAPAGGYTSINIGALRTGAYLPHGYQITINSGGGTAESVYIWNPGQTYTVGATAIGISTSQSSRVGWTPANVHSAGEPVCEKSQGTGQFVNATNFASFMSILANRYNGLAGYGKIDVFQVGNESYTINNQVQGQGAYNTSGGSPASWDTSSAWDNGGAILAPVYVAARNAIKAVNGQSNTVVWPCSVFHANSTGRQYMINWMTGLVSRALAGGGTLDGADIHYYRVGTKNWDGTLILDPTQNTYTDATQSVVNVPAISLILADFKAIFSSHGIKVALACTETGWDIYDDGNGPLTTLTAALASGAAVSTLPVSASYTHPATIRDRKPISIDYNSTGITEIVYAYGQSASGATSIPITTDPLGSTDTQAPWTPINTHNSGAQVYVADATTVTQAVQSTYIQAMYTALRLAGASYCLVYTDNPLLNTVTTTVNPAWSQETKSITQTIASVYTYMQAYSATATYSAAYPTWLAAVLGNPQVLITIGSNTIGASGGTLYFLEDSWSIKYQLNQRWQATFTVIDETGTVFFNYHDLVIITDATLGVLYTGFVADDTYDEQNAYPDGAIEHQITCMDLRGLFDKRTSNLTYVTPTVAGKIATDIVTQTMGAEGVIAHYATQTTATQADWAAGTLTGVVAALSVGDGDLELTPAAGSMTTSILLQSDWAAKGALSGVVANVGGDLSLNGTTRNWDNSLDGNQTLYGLGNPSQTVNSQGQLQLTCTAGSETRSRQDYAGLWADSTLTVDIFIAGAIPFVGVTYRTTTWNNNDNSYAYAIECNLSSISLRKGTNGGSGPSSQLATHAFSPPLAAGWYTLKVVTTTSGSNVVHQVSLAGSQDINFTDATGYTAAGYIALRNRNLETFTVTDYFDNFGVMAAVSGTWTSTSQSVAGITTIATSVIEWDASLSQGGTVSVKSSIDGGSTYQNCSSGGVIPGLTKGVAGSGKSLIILVTLSTTTAAIMPDIQHLSWQVQAGYGASGTRISGPFSFAGVGQCGSTFIGWNANVPTSTALDMQASPDAVTWYDVTAQNGGQLPWINGTPQPTTDGFDGGTLNNYTSTYQTGGVASTWSIDSANSRVKATGGTTAIFSSNLISAQNVAALTIMDQSDSGGLVFCMVDSGNFYFVQVADSQSSNATPNTISLYKATTAAAVPFSAYGSSVASATLPTAGQLATAVGGTDSAVTTKIGTGTGYGEIAALGTSQAWGTGSLSGGTAIGLPTGLGWLRDTAQLSSQQMVAGNWTAALTMRIGVGSATATFYVRAFAYDTVAKTYTAIGTTTLAAQTITTTKTTYTFSAAAFGAYTFGAHQRLYLDCWPDVTANSGGGTNNLLTVRLSTTATTGVAGDMEMDMPGAIPASASTSLLGTAPISFLHNTYHIVRAQINKGVITVTFDGTAAIAYSDSVPLAAGFVGLWNNGTGTHSRYYYLWIQPQGDDLTSQVVYTKQVLSTADTTVTPQVLDVTVCAFGPQIDAGALIPSVSYAYTFCDKNIDDLAKQSNTNWWCDQNYLLNFNSREGLPAPWVLQSYNLGMIGSDIEVDGNVQADMTGDQYRNRQVLTNVINSATFTDTFVGDGSRTSFTLRYPVAPGTVPTVLLDNVSQKLGIKGTVGSQWYYAANDPVLAEDTTGPTLVLTDTLSVTYSGVFADTVIVNNVPAQQALAPRDRTSGIVEAVEDVSSKNMTYAAALVYGQALLNRWCVVDKNNAPIGTSLRVLTLRGGLQVGMLWSVMFPELNLQDQLLLIHEIDVSMKTQPNNTVQYSYLVTASQLPPIKTFPALLAQNLLQ